MHAHARDNNRSLQYFYDIYAPDRLDGGLKNNILAYVFDTTNRDTTLIHEHRCSFVLVVVLDQLFY